QARAHVQAGLFQLADLFQQRLGRQHHAVADVAGNVRMHDARRYQAQNGFIAIDPQRVARIMAALETYDTLRRLSQPVDDLALAFVTPLGADHHNILAHVTYRLIGSSHTINQSADGLLIALTFQAP